MSSRNAYLTPDQRSAAAALPRSMKQAIARLIQGEPTNTVLDDLRGELTSAGFGSIDYAELRRGDDLGPADSAMADSRLFVAARIGGTRLIDNMPLT